jgi:tetratricopeptide (TPR) repeat protein
MMKAIYFYAAILFLMVSCGQPSVKEKAAATEGAKKDASSIRKDTTQESRTRLTMTRSDTVIPLENMQNEQMQQAKSAYQAGVNYYNSGDLEGALEQFKTSLEFFPESNKAAHFIARIYFERGEQNLALSYYEDAVRYDPTDSVSILGLGQVYFAMNDYEKAMEYYDRAITAGPRYALAYYNRGTLRGMQKDYIPALDDLNLAIKLDPKNPKAYMNRGMAFFYLQNIDAACDNWNKAADMGLSEAIKAVEIYCSK